MFKRPVIGSFGLCWKTAGGKLSHLKMISDALAAYPLFFTRFVAAIAFFQVLSLVTLHSPRLLPIQKVLIHPFMDYYQMSSAAVNGMKGRTTRVGKSRPFSDFFPKSERGGPVYEKATVWFFRKKFQNSGFLLDKTVQLLNSSPKSLRSKIERHFLIG